MVPVDGPGVICRSGRLRGLSMQALPTLPIVAALPALAEALESGRQVVLEAPPGAGKSTVVPLALLDAAWRGDERIVMLEPRRIAARAVAERMATLLGERCGERVGFRTRLESRVGPRTRLEVVTEGILTRQLQHDPALEGVGLRDLRRVPRARPAGRPRARARARVPAAPAARPAHWW